jgi:hypothetical protein
MRTTVDIEAGLLKRLRAEAHRRGVSFKDLLNRVLHRGLEERPRGTVRYACPSFPMGVPAPPLSLDKSLALAVALEDEEIAREMELRK